MSDRWDDGAALEEAVIRGVSRFRDPGRGQGLRASAATCGRWDGKLSVRSGTARIAIVPSWDEDVPLEEKLSAVSRRTGAGHHSRSATADRMNESHRPQHRASPDRVGDLYSNLVTRPTGAAVRDQIEQQLRELGERTLTVIDFSHVG